MQVIIGADHLGNNFIERLREKFPSVDFYDCMQGDEIPEETSMAEVYFGWPNSTQFKLLTNLKWIACPGMGIDKIAKYREILDSDVIITNSPKTHVNAMADYAIGAMISLAHRFNDCYKDQSQRVWDTQKYNSKIVELTGRTVGIFGLGEIGRAVAQRCVGFGMEIFSVDPNPSFVPDFVSECWTDDRLDELCKISDFLVVTAPLLASTRSSIDVAQLELMKKGSFIVVVSRGGIVDELALMKYLKLGHLGGAALDATVVEPLPIDSDLWNLDNIIITPHVSALSPELYEMRRIIFEDNLTNYINNKNLNHICDKTASI